ncbi:carbamoyltransferase [Candidatus Pelagibacter sp.]|nr:carbamoyltransferase [Candidatus Pelagibacter sp.]
MSIILGLNCYHTDSSACLIKNGKLIFAIEEERLNRIKHTSDLPLLSIEECLKKTNTNENEITHIAFNTNPNSNLFKKFKFLIKKLNFKNNFVKRYNDKKLLNKIFQNKFSFNDKVKFVFVEHHLAHISSAFYASSYDNAIGLSIDGSGDFTSLMIAECSNKEIKVKKRVYFPDSLGIFYHAMTQFIGFRKFGDEYKMMGLASYGSPIYFDKLLNNLFLNSKNFFKLNLDFFNHGTINFDYSHIGAKDMPDIYTDKLDDLFKPDIAISAPEMFKKNFAASVQKIYEFYFNKILKEINSNKFSKNLVFAGGCALNSSANNILLSKKFTKNIFIPVAPGDNGGCLGAAFYTCKKKIINNDFDNPFLGTAYNDVEIENIIKKKYLNKITYKKFINENEKYDVASNMIINKCVIGWFQDRMEFGPRALGNRSILADPRNKKIKELINLKIKRRESFRPFAPSVLSDFQNDWFEEIYLNQYMSSVMKAKSDKKHLIPGVVHIDGSSRVQTVLKKNNKTFYNLIYNFFLKTGVPLLLNTSFNENEPIVRSPEEAIECLLRTNMDGLFINSFFIKKI